MTKTKAVKFFHDNTFEEKKYTIEAGKLYDKKNEVDFSPICVFTERKPRRAFYRGAKKLLFFVDGTLKALKFDESMKGLQTYWLQSEAKLLVKKEVAKTLEEHKPMKWSQFFVLLAVLIIVTGLLVRIGMILGAF